MDMQPIEPNRPLSATLTAEQWNVVMHVMRKHPLPWEVQRAHHRQHGAAVAAPDAAAAAAAAAVGHADRAHHSRRTIGDNDGDIRRKPLIVASELTEGFPCRFAPSASRFFKCGEVAERVAFALNGEVSKEPYAVAAMPEVDAFNGGGGTGRGISQVLTVRRNSQIADPVVQRVPIDVVDNVRNGFSSLQQPYDTMCLHEVTTETKAPIILPAFGAGPCWLASELGVPPFVRFGVREVVGWSFAPCENASDRIVIHTLSRI